MYTSLVSCSAMQLIVTLTMEAEAAGGGRAALSFISLKVFTLSLAALALISSKVLHGTFGVAFVGAVGSDIAWMARWTVNDLPVPGRPLM